ncbi:MAG: hypothetical protein Q8922_01175 [Bacteroidota bacterium]|nr:hypothetical protein [Bacteroidota bacterium]MDP4232161.1 hypothetical protein [Bacteroidota bacterium]MDP4241131.1 hypothetical protein [Bacteroidota bacterium]MDP4286523.1 hypothetical protein [Bacteroidota bacterium]
MTIIAQLNTLVDAYAGMEALRKCAIPPELSRNGEYLLLSVDDDFAEHARAVLAAEGNRWEQCLRSDAGSNWPSFDDYNA